MEHMRSSFTLAGVLALVSGACIGTIGGGGSDGLSSGPGASAGSAAGAMGSASASASGGDNPAGFAPAPASLRRLTRAEYTRTVQDLLGNVIVPDGLEGDTFEQGFSTVGATKAPIGDTALGKFDAAALDLAHQIFADGARRATLLGCTPVAADDACVKGFVQSFGRRAFRRPLTLAEVGRYVGVVTAAAQAFGGQVWSGLEYATAAFLESPNFLYRPELGETDKERPGRRIFTSYEMASRISYFLWGTMPDKELLDAAERGELATRDGVTTAAARLLASPRADASLLHFFDEHFALTQLDQLAKNITVYPAFTASLGAAMRRETEQMITSTLLQGDADFRRLLDTETTFVNADLAKLHGLPPIPGADFVKVTLPPNGPRLGILTTAGILALNARNGRTSPTLRGLFVTGRFLCWEPGDPPPNINVNAIDDGTANGTWTTMRERLEAHRANPVCAGCHKVMDPPGLALEHYDGIGRYRDTDHGAVLDVAGDLGGAPFDGARGLAEAVQQDPRLPECLARQVYRFATGHREVKGEEAVIQSLTSRLRDSGWKIRALAKDLVASDGFRFATEPR